MGNIVVVTESTACIPKELVELYGIEIVPVYLIFGEKSFRDGIDLTPAEFYAMLHESPVLPTTASPSVGDYLAVFRRLSERAKGIVCICLASEFAGMYNAAVAAKAMLPEMPIAVIDSHSATMAQGFAALAAARVASAGGDLQESVATAHVILTKVQTLFVLDTLEYIVKGGRVPRAVAWAANLLDVKPILSLRHGKADVVERVRSKGRALQRMVEIMESTVGNVPVHAAIHHANVLGQAEEMRREIQALFNCVELYITEFTAVMGAHTGPGLVGVAFYSD